MKQFFVLLLLCMSVNLFATNWYVAPNGTGGGTFQAPFGFQAALNSTLIHPGDSVLMRAGIYKGIFTTSLSGTTSQPIFIKPFNGERVILDGSLAGQSFKNRSVLTLNGHDLWIMELEITNSDPERTITVSGSNPNERRGQGTDDLGPGNKIINCLIYDVGQGISAWKPAIGGEYYGNVVWNNGWYAPDRFHGHGIYSQNEVGVKTFTNNVVLNNFSYGLHIYGETGSLKGFYIDKNVFFNNPQVMGGYTPLENITLNENYFYSFLQLGYNDNTTPNSGLTLTNNYLPLSMSIRWFTNVTVTGNTIFNGSKYAYPFNMLFRGTPNVTTYSFDFNKYFWSYNPGPGYPSDLGFGYKNTLNDNEGAYLLPEWRSLGKDLNSTVTNMPMKNSTDFVLSGKKTFVTKNKYNAKKATVTIYNWDKSSTVDLDIDSVISIGENYELHNTQDYFGDILYGTYNGTLIVPMTNHTVTKPLGYASEIAPSTFPDFGSFILIKGTGTPPPTPTCDTVYVPVYIHDTVRTTVHDTIKITNTVHDTIIKTIHDTLRITTTVHDTIYINNGGSSVNVDANAGADTTIVGATAFLKGKPTVTYLWKKISGPSTGDYFSSTNTATTEYRQLGRGTYVVELQTTFVDSAGTFVKSTIDRITITKN